MYMLLAQRSSKFHCFIWSQLCTVYYDNGDMYVEMNEKQ